MEFHVKPRDSLASSTIEAGASDNDPTISSLLEGVIGDSQSSSSTKGSSTKGITVNLVLSSSSVDTWHISKDISLTVWVRHSRKTKKQLLSELGDCADDAIEFLEKSEHVAAAAAAEIAAVAATICTNLARHGINKLSQWEKCPVEKHKDILSDDMLFFFSMRVSEWREKQWKWREKQWNEFLSNLVQKKVPSFSHLTYHHSFTTSYGSSSPMLGEDRRSSLSLLLKRLRQGLAAPSKELNPIHSLIAQSRQGKSLFLDVVCEHVRQSGQFAICISYNNRTKYEKDEKDTLLESLAWYFWARVVHAIVNAVNKQEITWGTFKSYPFLPCLTIKRVLDLINKCLPMFAGKPVLFAADEFSHVLKDLKKLEVSDPIRRTAVSSITTSIYNENCTLLVSGFEVENNSFFETISTRPVENYWLPPVTSADRKHYQPLIQQLKDYYKKNNDFPFLLYEWTKFSPGLLGLWLEKLINCKVSNIDELLPPVLQDISSMVAKDKTFFASYWKECFDLRGTTNVLKLNCMKKYEAVGTFIQLSSTEGFLNPFIVIHPSVIKEYMKSESDLFNRIIAAFTKDPSEWVPAAKGDALEKMIACALELRQIHSSGSFPFTTIVNALCGLKKYPTAATIVTDAAYTFRKSVALEEVETFPCHTCRVGKKGVPCESWMNPTKDEVEKRQQKGIAALKSYGVIHPTAACNKGCNVVLVVDCEDKGIAILMFEAKYYSKSTELDGESASMKAYDALEGLLNGAMGDCKVFHVCFIMCTTGDKEIYYDMNYKPIGRKKPLRKCIADLNKMETTVSLHHVRNADHWMNLLTPVLYYGLPDADEGTNIAKPQQRSKSY